MPDHDSNCMGIRRPPLFIAILDFIVCLVLIIGILQVSYSEEKETETWELQGRIFFCVMLFSRLLCSVFSEFTRQRWIKGLFLDKRETVKIFAIMRYLFTSVVLVPGMTLCNRYLEFKGTMIAIISAILVFQELVVFIMIAYKIRKANPPPKI